MEDKSQLEDVDLLFVQKPTWISETKIIGIEIHDFLKKIEKEEEVRSPKIELAGLEFYIVLTPSSFGKEDGEFFIFVSLVNSSHEELMTSVSFVGSGVAQGTCWEMIVIEANGGLEGRLLNLEKFKAWAKTQGDVFKLKATVTLHRKMDADDGWTRSCQEVLSCVLVLMFCSGARPGWSQGPRRPSLPTGRPSWRTTPRRTSPSAVPLRSSGSTRPSSAPGLRSSGPASSPP